MAMSYAVRMILVLITLVTAFLLIGTFYSPVVRSLLGITDELTSDGDRIKAYNDLRNQNMESIDSINALLFSVNSLAHIDTNLRGQEEAFLEDNFNLDGERYFGETTVTYIDANLEKVTINENYAKQVSDYLIRCQFMFEDNGKDKTRCYEMNVETGQVKISETEIKKALDEIRKDGYINEPGDCDELCIDRARWLKGMWRLKFEDNVIEPNNPLYMCEQDTLIGETIYISRKEQHNACKNSGSTEHKLGMRVKDFYMEQKYGNMDNVNRFIHGYRPSILYYEVADESITEDFEQGLYEWDWDEVILWETVFFAFDFMPGGSEILEFVGKAVGKNVAKGAEKEAAKEWLKPIIKNIVEKIPLGKNFIETMRGIRDTFRAFNDFLDELFLKLRLAPYNALVSVLESRIGKASVDNLLKQYGQEFFEQRLFKNAGAVEAFVKTLGSDLTQEQREQASEAIKKKYSEILEKELSDMLQSESEILSSENARKLAVRLDNQIPEIKNALKGIVPDSSLDNADELLLMTLNDQLGDGLAGFSMRGYKQYVNRNIRIMGRFLNFLPRTLNNADELTKEQAETILKEIIDDNHKRLFKDLNPRDTMTFFRKYGTDPSVIEKELTSGLSQAEQKNLQIISEQFGPGVQMYDDLERYYRNKLKTGDKRKHLLLAAMWMVSAKMESDAEIFHPVGTNAFGYKNAISTPVIFDDSMRKFWNYESDESKYEDFFKHYGNSKLEAEDEKTKNAEEEDTISVYETEAYQGNIPELYNYFVALEKDNKEMDIFDQKPERFYLIAPCKADLDVKITHVECYGKPSPDIDETSLINSFLGRYPTYESGETNPVTGEFVEFYDGTNKMLYSLDDNGEPVKHCYNNAWAKITSGVDITDGTINPFEETYSPVTITVNPSLDRDKVPNYCYAGYDGKEAIIWATLNVGFPLLGTVGGGLTCSAVTAVATGGAGVAAAPICLAAGNLLGGIVGGLIYEGLEAGYMGGRIHWPYHTQSYNDRSTAGIVTDILDGKENEQGP